MAAAPDVLRTTKSVSQFMKSHRMWVSAVRPAHPLQEQACDRTIRGREVPTASKVESSEAVVPDDLCATKVVSWASKVVLVKS